MPAQAGVAHANRAEIDTVAKTIRFRREFDAPPSDIFDAWTKPDEVTKWWDPSGAPLVSCEIDLRAGGAFKFVSKGHVDMPFAGVYREIVRPQRLVFEAMGSVGRVLLSEVSGKTSMSVEIECPTAEHFQTFIAIGVDIGTSQTLDNLVAFVGRTRMDKPR